MKLLRLSACIILLFLSFSVKSQINWLNSYDQAKKIAKEQNKLIIVDCWATWCGPCLKMDDDVWSNEIIQAYADNFIFVKIDMSSGAPDPNFKADAIPKIFVTDAWNSQMKDFTGYQSKSRMNTVLKSFCFDVSLIYDGKKEVKKNNKDIESLVNLAMLYQEAYINLDREARIPMRSQSVLFFKKAEKVLKKNKDAILLERVNILNCMNKSPKKCLKILNKIDPKEKKNIVLKDAILVKTYLALEDKISAQEYFNLVKTEELPFYDFLKEERNLLN